MKCFSKILACLLTMAFLTCGTGAASAETVDAADDFAIASRLENGATGDEAGVTDEETKEDCDIATGITITQQPTKMTYVQGHVIDSLDLSGLELDITYADGSVMHWTYGTDGTYNATTDEWHYNGYDSTSAKYVDISCMDGTGRDADQDGLIAIWPEERETGVYTMLKLDLIPYAPVFSANPGISFFVPTNGEAGLVFYMNGTVDFGTNGAYSTMNAGVEPVENYGPASGADEEDIDVDEPSNVDPGDDLSSDTTTSSATYTNLVDDETRATLKRDLRWALVPNANITATMNAIEQYVNTTGDLNRVQSGYAPFDLTMPEYDEETIDTLWDQANPEFIGYNCRITAFEIMKDFISITDTGNGDTSNLFMDEEALLETTPSLFGQEDLDKFEAMYAAIPTSSSTNVEDQIMAQRDYWDSLGIEFHTPFNISLISVYIHNHFDENDNELIVGHTGVLLRDTQGYLFFEKLSFDLPYQAIRFQNKDDLKTYLMNCYDVDTTGESAQPFILENGDVL